MPYNRPLSDEDGNTDSSGLSSALSDIERQTKVTSPRDRKRGAKEAIDGQPKPKRGKANVVKTEEADTEVVENLARKIAPKAKVALKTVEETSIKIDIEFQDRELAVQTNRTSKKARKKQVLKIEEVDAEEHNRVDSSPSRPKLQKRKKTTTKSRDPPAETQGGETAPEPKPKRHRKTKEEKEAELMPLAARTIGHKLHLGAHVSAAGGVHNSVTNAHHIGGNAFALFLKSQRKWDNPALKPEHSSQFRTLCETHNYTASEVVLPHGSYLVNLATSDPMKAKQAYDSFLDDLQRCEILGIKLYNFHPGNTNGEPRPAAIARLASHLNTVHAATTTVITLLENMAAQPTGNTLGSTFADLRDVIALIDDKSRIGVTLDTCHAFAAGHDLRTPSAFAATIAAFDGTVGMRYLRALHLNDSKAPFASHRDLHANIGTGFLGLRAFHNIVNEPRFVGLPLVLETPIERRDESGKMVEDKGVWAREIKLLESLVGMDVEGEEFKKLEGDLEELGREEREKYQEQFDRKVKDMTRKEAGGGRRKRKKKESEESSGEESGHDSS